METEPCNEALDLIGVKSIDSRYDYNTDPSVQAIKCRLHYPKVRKSLIRSFEWPFAQTRIKLVDAWATATAYTTDRYAWISSVLYKCKLAHTSGTFATDLAVPKWEIYADRPSCEWDYQYVMPADFLRLKEVYESNGYYYENRMVLTDDTEVDLKYVRDIENVNEWDELFRQVFVYQLGLKMQATLAGTGRVTLEQRQLLLAELKPLMSKVRTICLQEGNMTGSNEWNDARTA